MVSAIYVRTKEAPIKKPLPEVVPSTIEPGKPLPHPPPEVFPVPGPHIEPVTQTTVISPIGQAIKLFI
jgi:hypothetical protein